MISGPSEISGFKKLKEVGMLYQWEEQLIELQKIKMIWRIEEKWWGKRAKIR